MTAYVAQCAAYRGSEVATMDKQPTFERGSHGWTKVGGLSACFKSDSGEDLVVHGDVSLPPVLSHNCEFEAVPNRVHTDDPEWKHTDLDRDLTESEEKAALEAMFQKACDLLMARN